MNTSGLFCHYILFTLLFERTGYFFCVIFFFFSIILFSTRVSEEELEVKMTGSLSDLFRYSPLTILLLFLRISHTIFSKFLILPSRSINAFLKTSCQRILCYLDFICKNDLNSVTKIQSKCKVFLLCDLTIKSDKNCRN